MLFKVRLGKVKIRKAIYDNIQRDKALNKKGG